jgi:hypothetical protein
MRIALRATGSLIAVLLLALAFERRIEFMSPCAPMAVTLLSARCTGSQDLYEMNASTEPRSPGDIVTVTVSASGVWPARAHLESGGEVTLVNADSRTHVVESEGGDCPAFMVTLRPGEHFHTIDLERAHECGFHERHDVALAENHALDR